MLGLAPSRAGKTPTCNIGCVGPLISLLELRINRSILVDIPWDEIAPAHIHEWLKVYLKCHGTSPELLLAEILPCISALIGNTTP